MGRIIRTTNPTRQRALSIKKMTTDIRDFLRASKKESDLIDLGKTLAVSLQEIKESVDRTAEAWEKRDYWLKADAFRRQWQWAERFLDSVNRSVSANDTAGLQNHIIALGEKLSSL